VPGASVLGLGTPGADLVKMQDQVNSRFGLMPRIVFEVEKRSFSSLFLDHLFAVCLLGLRWVVFIFFFFSFSGQFLPVHRPRWRCPATPFLHSL